MAKRFIKFIPFLIVLLSVFLAREVQAETVSSVNFGLSYFSGANPGGTVLSNPGLNIDFETGQSGKYLRSVYGAYIERGSNSNSGSLLEGALFFGGDIAPHTDSRLTPFVGAKLIGSWANFTTSSTNSNGILYGGTIDGGAEFAVVKSAQKETCVRVTTGYRLLAGKVGSLTGANLSAVTLTFGLTF